MVATVPEPAIILGSLVRLSDQWSSFRTRSYDQVDVRESGPSIYEGDLGLVLGVLPWARIPLAFLVWSHAGSRISMGWIGTNMLVPVQTVTSEG